MLETYRMTVDKLHWMISVKFYRALVGQRFFSCDESFGSPAKFWRHVGAAVLIPRKGLKTLLSSCHQNSRYHRNFFPMGA